MRYEPFFSSKFCGWGVLVLVENDPGGTYWAVHAEPTLTEEIARAAAKGMNA